MMNKKIAVGLDIGTTKIVAAIGRYNEHNKVEILGMGKAESFGVKNGVVNNISQTVDSIEKAIAQAQENSGLLIKEVVPGIAGQHIRSMQHSDYITRPEVQSIISDEDIDLLKANAKKLMMMPGEQMLHVLPQEFKVDSQSDVKDPRGMAGGRLEANFHIVVGQMTSIYNLMRCVEMANLNIKGVTLEPLASADAVLSPEEKEAGVILIDIGGGTTDIAIFKDGIIRHTAVIPMGGKIITEDIKEGCEIIEKQAELLKVRYGSCWPGENSEREIVSIPGLRGHDHKEVTLRTLSQIIYARMKEIIESVHQEIKNYGYTEPRKRIIAGIVLTGGGAQLKHITQLFEYVTGISTRIGYPSEHLASGSSAVLSGPLYATSIGLVMQGLEDKTITSDMAVAPNATVEPEPEQEPIQPVQEEKIQKEEKESKEGLLDMLTRKVMTFFENDVK